MYIPNDDKRNYLFCRLKLLIKSLDTASLKLVWNNAIKVPKVLSQRIILHHYKTLGTIVIFSPMYPSSLANILNCASFRGKSTQVMAMLSVNDATDWQAYL